MRGFNHSDAASCRSWSRRRSGRPVRWAQRVVELRGAIDERADEALLFRDRCLTRCPADDRAEGRGREPASDERTFPREEPEVCPRDDVLDGEAHLFEDSFTLHEEVLQSRARGALVSTPNVHLDALDLTGEHVHAIIHLRVELDEVGHLDLG